jgi:hypothetical protein
MSVANGRPEPRIVLKSGGKYGTTIDDVTLATSSRFIPTFSPIALQHELDDYSLRRRIDGYRFTLELPYDAIQGTDLVKLAKVLNLNTGYDTIMLYPWKTDKPNYAIEVMLADKDIALENFMLLAHKDFSITLISVRLLDAIPLSQGDVILAGNITWPIKDIVGQIKNLG